MSKPNIDGNFGKKSNLDLHPSQLDDKTYRHAINANLEARDGSTLMLTNEQSNILCSLFKPGFKVVNATADINTNRTYFFLTNPTTGCSEIGYIQDTEDVTDLSDVESTCGCNISNLLSKPLEDIVQVETCTYVTLLSDCDCENLAAATKCLAFDIKKPISTQIKQEKCGTVIYFTDDIDYHFRRLEVDNLEQYFNQDDHSVCPSTSVPICIDCEKLKVFRSYTNPCIEEIEVISNGTLTPANYVFYVAYADKNGQVLSRYSAISGEVFVRNPDRFIYQQVELDTPTNQAIKLSLSKLDRNASHYKIAVRATAVLDSAVSNFEVGLYSVAQTEVIFHSTQTLKRITTEELLVERPKYIKVKSLESANNMLFINDLKAQPEVNLQPVVNFMGQYAKWRSYITEEEIYNDPVLTEKYRSAMRNEVYPYGIRFGTSDYVTAIFPLISRIALDADEFFDGQDPEDPATFINDIVADGDNEGSLTGVERDIYSVLANGYECADDIRIYKWQFYNTATKIGDISCKDTLECHEETVNEQRTCETEYNFEGCEEGGVTTFILDDDDADFDGYEFTTAEQFVKDYLEDLTQEYPCLDKEINPVNEEETCTSNGVIEFTHNAPTGTGITPGTYTDVPSSSVAPPGGTGATWDIVVNGSGNVTEVTVNEAGTGYTVGDVITIDGTQAPLVGGASPADDIIITITDVVCDSNDLFGLDAAGNSLLDDDGMPVSSCDPPTFVDSETRFVRFADDGSFANVYLEYEECGDYTVNKAPKGCNVYETDGDGDIHNLNHCCSGCRRRQCKRNLRKCDEDDEPCCDWDYTNAVDGSCHSKNPVFERAETLYGGESCDKATFTPLDNDYELPSHISPFYIEEAVGYPGTDLIGSNPAVPESPNLNIGVDVVAPVGSPQYDDWIQYTRDGNGGGNPAVPIVVNRPRSRCRGNDISTANAFFSNNIHVNGLWFTVPESLTPNGVVINISDMLKKSNRTDCLLYSDTYRYSLFNGCNSPVVSGLIQDDETDCGTNQLEGTLDTPYTIEGYIRSYTYTVDPTGIPTKANESYENLASIVVVSANGSGATFNVTRDENGVVDSVTTVNEGSGYADGDTIKIDGTLIDGTTPLNDINITIKTTENDESFIDGNGHIMFFTRRYIETFFPNDIVLAIDSPYTESLKTAPSQDEDGCTSGAVATVALNAGSTAQPFPNAAGAPTTIYDLPTTGGTGEDLTFDITIDGAGNITPPIVVNNPGVSYTAGDTVRIFGDLLTGGTMVTPGLRPADDIYIDISTLAVASGCTDLDYGYVTGTRSCFSVNAYTPKLKQVKIETDKALVLRKTCTYTAECTQCVYEELRCEPKPWEEGTFAYWESTEKYPDNDELYNSSTLDVEQSDFDGYDASIKTTFENVFASAILDGVYTLDADTTNFTCKEIRHFKYPSNAISSYQDGLMVQSGLVPFKSNKVYPIGFHIDNDVINAFLDIAVNNDLITQEFRDNLEFYEVFRGDSRLHKSIIGKGVTFDSWEYTEENEDIQFANFPFNDNRDNELIYQDGKRDDFITHTDSTTKRNNKYFFHSPEFSFDKPNVPFELEVESYLFGQSRGHFAEVEDHPKMVVLSDKGERVARVLGGIESTLELITDITDRLLSAAETSSLFNWGQGVAWAGFAIYSAQRIIEEALVGSRQKIFEWLEIFYNNGTPHNHGAYYVAEGYYNKIATSISEGERLRGIVDSKYVRNGTYKYNVVTPSGERDPIKINNFNRVSSVFLHLGEDKHELEIPQSYYRDYDNSRISVAPCYDINEPLKKSPEIQRNVQSPYLSLKQYSPAQYGTVDDIRWISTGYCGYLADDNECDAIFGGDTYISRFAFKRHFPFFLSPMISPSGSLASNTPFSYSEQRNVGFPRYYVDYKIDPVKDYGSNIFIPYVTSFFNFDCQTAKKIYITPPSKFYLWYYGIPNMLVESRINLNLRYGQNNKEKDFFPNQTDIVDWTQEKNVSNFYDNFYYYSYAYSSENDAYAYRFLDYRYNKADWDCRADHKDRTHYSLADNNDQDTIDNWQVFKANNFNDFGIKYGEFIGLKNIESEKVVGRFENGMVIFNAFNTLEGTVEDVQVGTGGVFATRPTEYFRTSLGYGGTQHQAWESCEFGHFWTDEKRGRIHHLKSGGQGVDDITLYGWKNWFRENLPIKLKKQLPGLPNSFFDNAYNGIGIAMTWDDRYSRLFVTKRDYKYKCDLDDLIICEEDIFHYPGLQEQIDTLAEEGWEYQGVDECRLRFTRTTEVPIPNDTDIHVVLDASGSFDLGELEDIRNAVYEWWFNDLPEQVTGYSGEFYEYGIGNSQPGNLREHWVRAPWFVVDRIGEVGGPGTGYPAGTDIGTKNVIILAFFDEAWSTGVYTRNNCGPWSGAPEDLVDDISIDNGKITAFTWSNTTPPPNGVYSVTDPGSPAGYDAVFDVTVAGGVIVSVVMTNSGRLYTIGDTVKLAGTLMGGTAANDITVNVTDIITPLYEDVAEYIALYPQFASIQSILYPIIRKAYPLGGPCEETTDCQFKNFFPHAISTFKGSTEMTIAEANSFSERNPVYSEAEWQFLKDALVADTHYTFDGLENHQWFGRWDRFVEYNEDCSERINVIDPEQLAEDLNEFLEGTVAVETEEMFIQLETVDFTDTTCWEDCSWTVAWSPIYQTWIAHYDFKPNYYVPHTNYFQSGINADDEEFGIWSHLLTKKSFQVFYGKKYSWIVEFPIKESFLNKRKGSVAYWLDVKRFHTDSDFAENRNQGFDEAVIYNHDENSGKLNLIRSEKNNLYQLQQYPKHTIGATDILATQEQRKWTFNYIFDMVSDKYSNVPIWLNDCANVHKTLNPKAFDYRPTLKNNLRGDWFMVRLTQSSDSQHQYTFKWLTSDNTMYER